MNPRTQVLHTTLTTVGALLLLGVLAWVVYAISQPRIPNTGDTVPNNMEAPLNSTVHATTPNRMLESVGDKGGAGGGSNDPTGKSHSE